MNNNTIILLVVAFLVICTMLSSMVLISNRVKTKKHIPHKPVVVTESKPSIIPESKPETEYPYIITTPEQPIQTVPVKPIQTVPVKPAPIIPIQTIPVQTTPTQPKPVDNIWVSEHNRVRSQVGQGPVAWNDQIAAGALEHAKKCKFQHSDQATRKLGSDILGENLSFGSPFSAYDDKKMFALWENEKQYYTYPQGPSQSSKGETGHYTQIVNKNVKQIGCGCANCNNDKLCVCRYLPIQLGDQPPY